MSHHKLSDGLRDVIHNISTLTNNTDRPFVVALDGRSGCGKSTAAKFLATKLDASIISGDDFFSGGVSLRKDTPEELAHCCIDWQKQRAAFRELRQGRPARFYPFDWHKFDGSLSSSIVKINPTKFIIFEGVYSNRKELRDLIDFSILLELDGDERMKRLLKREGEISEWELQWHRGEDWYFANDATPDKFDVLL